MSAAVGASFVPVTVITIVAVSVPPFPSETVEVKLSDAVSPDAKSSAALWCATKV